MSLIISIIGISLIFSEIQKWSKQVRLSSKILSSIQLSVLCIFILLHYFCTHGLIRSIVVLVFFLSISLCLPIFHKMLETSISKEFHVILDEMILGIQAGKSLSRSLSECLHFRKTWDQAYWNDLIEILNKKMIIDQISSAQKREIFQQIIQINNSQTKLVDQLQSLRNFEKKKVDFRRRSGAATQQIRLQTSILTVVFASSCLFVIARNGFWGSLKLVTISSAVFFLGIVIQIWIMKSQKWSI